MLDARMPVFNRTLTVAAIVIASLSLAITVGIIIYECAYKTSGQQRRKKSSSEPENDQTTRDQQPRDLLALVVNPPPYSERADASSLAATDNADCYPVQEQSSMGYAVGAPHNTGEGVQEWPRLSTAPAIGR